MAICRSGAIEAHCSLLVAMGCTVLVYAETSGGIAGDRRRSLSSRPRLDDADWRDFGSRLTELGDRLSRRGIRLAYHHHVGTIVEIQGSQQTLFAGGNRIRTIGPASGKVVDAKFQRSDPGRSVEH
jgi:inosose dehydratase